MGLVQAYRGAELDPGVWLQGPGVPELVPNCWWVGPLPDTVGYRVQGVFKLVLAW